MEFLLANKSYLLFALGAVIMIVILMRRYTRYFGRRRPSKTAALANSNRQQPLLDAPPDILRWQVEMHETARDLKGELDTKIAVLQRLVIDARQEAERLEEIVRRAEQVEIS